jgi:hypothetical protein
LGGLSERTRKWYTERILNVLREQEHGATTTEIIFCLRSLKQRYYPIEKGRITSFLKELRNSGVIRAEEGKDCIVWILNERK